MITVWIILHAHSLQDRGSLYTYVEIEFILTVLLQSPISGSTITKSSLTSVDSWITYFCSLAGHELYAEVPEDYIEDEFNLTGLSAIVPYYELALDIILNVDIDEMVESDSDGMSNDLDPSDEEGSDGLWKETPLKVPKNAQRPDVMALERYAGMLYGLIHQRYILSRNGLRQMVRFTLCAKSKVPHLSFFFLLIQILNHLTGREI